MGVLMTLYIFIHAKHLSNSEKQLFMMNMIWQLKRRAGTERRRNPCQSFHRVSKEHKPFTLPEDVIAHSEKIVIPLIGVDAPKYEFNLGVFTPESK